MLRLPVLPWKNWRWIALRQWVNLMPVYLLCPPRYGGGINDAFVWRLSVLRLSVVYIGPKSRTERPRKTKIGTEVAHVTRDSDPTFKVKRSKVKVTRPVYSPRRLHTGSCSGQRGNVLSVGNYAATLPSASAAVGLATRGATAPTGGGERREHMVSHAHSVEGSC